VEGLFASVPCETADTGEIGVAGELLAAPAEPVLLGNHAAGGVDSNSSKASFGYSGEAQIGGADPLTCFSPLQAGSLEQLANTVAPKASAY